MVVAALSMGPLSPVMASQSSALSLQGFSGILNTPTGHVQEVGSLDALYSNQTDSFRDRGTPRWQDNYLFSVGMFSFAEISGRLTNNNLGVRDLSGNFKFSSSPLTAHYPLSPAVAVGMQDLGGGAAFFRTTYVAASADPFGWLRLSAGYGSGPDRMKGAFGGVELKAHEWVTLLSENDTRSTNIGLRLTTPPLPFIPACITVIASTSLNQTRGLVISAGFSLPLDFKKGRNDEPSTNQQAASGGSALDAFSSMIAIRETVPESSTPPSSKGSLSEPITKTHIDEQTASISVPSPTQHAPERSVPDNRQDFSAPRHIRDRLIAAGFVNVRVGVQGKRLVVEYENIRYNHNQLDAVGVVAGVATESAGEGFEQLRLVVKRKGICLLQIDTTLSGVRDWLARRTATVPTLSITQKLDSSDEVQFTGGSENSGWLRPSLMVYPALTTLVGTDYGVFDYQLSIRPELQTVFWPGGVFVARWDLPVSWSSNLDDGQVYSSYHTPPRMDRLMFFQAIKFLPGLVANLGAGKVLNNTNGTLNELNWVPNSGMHRFKLIQAWGRDNDNPTRHYRSVLLASYRVFLPRFDLALEGVGGRFWGQDAGILINIKRFFGDTSISLYYKNSVAAEDRQRWQSAGIQFEFPLTPRRDMGASPLQVRGNNLWSHIQETVIASPETNNANYLRPGLGTVPMLTQSLDLSFFDQGRFSEEYILSHTQRIREAWERYRNDL